MRLALVVLMGALLTGCMGNTFYVDSRFTPEEETQIQAADDQWVALGAKPIDFVWGQRVDVRDTGRRVLVKSGWRAAVAGCAMFALQNIAGCYNRNDIDTSRLIIAYDLVPEGRFQVVVSHELGHYYGLEHSHIKAAIMYPALNEESPDGPTEYDRSALSGVSQ